MWIREIGLGSFMVFFSFLLLMLLAIWAYRSYKKVVLKMSIGLFIIGYFLMYFLVLLAYPLIPLLERIFGFISPLSLVELSDMNRPLLRDLALKAPGTLQTLFASG